MIAFSHLHNFATPRFSAEDEDEHGSVKCFMVLFFSSFFLNSETIPKWLVGRYSVFYQVKEPMLAFLCFRIDTESNEVGAV